MQMIDLTSAKIVELLTDSNGHLWLNVDGVCAVRVQCAGNVSAEFKTARNRIDGKPHYTATQSIKAEYPRAE